MRGKKKLLERISMSTDIDYLKTLTGNLHKAADFSAIDDRDRDFRDLCDCEAACAKRIAELEATTNGSTMGTNKNETAELRPEVAAKVAQHYAHARKKHPYFADCLFLHGIADDANCAGSVLSGIRWCLNAEKDLHEVSAETALNCEIAEAEFALATGDKGAAVEECYDAIAVLLRIVDAIEGRQPLGDPKRGKRERKGAAK